MWKKTIALTTAAAALGLSTAVSAQTVCSSRSNFLDNLGKRYAESPTAIGLASNGSVLEVLTSKNGSWTIIITQPNGTTCMVANGESWETLTIASADPAA
ncbi:MAG: hypothetical protein QF893_22810 [Alphaproteobacteria bacterium]|jgi:hypothetical protein|nr:hypothetical protein [Alphaproteobacteria bacterium]